MQSQQVVFFLAGVLRVSLALLFSYVSCYFLMMDWRVLGYDPIQQEWTGESCYYLAPSVQVHGNITMIGGSACWANSLFRPLDSLLHSAKAAMGFRVFRSSLWTIWLFTFGLNLLLPFSSVIPRGSQSLRTSRLPIFLSLVAAGWYCGLILLYHLIRNLSINVFLGKSLALAGTIAALGAIYWIARPRNYALVAPLTIATVLGTIWLIVSLPCAWPYM